MNKDETIRILIEQFYMSFKGQQSFKDMSENEGTIRRFFERMYNYGYEAAKEETA